MNEVTINNDLTVGNGAGRALLMNRYRILRQLGQGGMGSVWLAEDILLDDKLFAVKMLPSILVSNKRAYNQLKSEALVSMKLVHQNIVALRAFEENGNNPFLVMDYIEGETLDDWLEERGTANGRAGARADRSREPGAGEDEIIRLLRPVAEALDYAHREGVVHRDVKPSNVIIRKDGHPFILDFGIAREIQETMTRVTGRMSSGTLMYMSPEQLNGESPRPAQDVYSFAAMVYECLAGDPPFRRGAIEDQIKNKAPDPLPADISIASAVMAGLAKSPHDRPGSCVEVLNADYGKQGKRSLKGGARRVWTGLLFGAVAVLGAGGVAFWLNRDFDAKSDLGNRVNGDIGTGVAIEDNSGSPAAVREDPPRPEEPSACQPHLHLTPSEPAAAETEAPEPDEKGKSEKRETTEEAPEPENPETTPEENDDSPGEPVQEPQPPIISAPDEPDAPAPSIPAPPEVITPQGPSENDVAEIANSSKKYRETLAGIENSEGFGQDKKSFDEMFNEAVRYRGEKRWSLAAEGFTNCVEMAKDIVGLDAKRRRAVDAKRAAEDAKATALGQNAEKYAGQAWLAANGDMSRAEQSFKERKFDGANGDFVKAEEKYLEAAKKSKNVKEFLNRLEREGFILDEKNNPRPAGSRGVLPLRNGAHIEMVWCPPGFFMMGSISNREASEMRHPVHITKGFWISRYEVTQDQWSAVKGGGWGGRKPQTDVSVEDCRWFCRQFPAKYGVSLPSEAQWEYACRAGTQTEYSLGRLSNGRKIDGNKANVNAFWGVKDVGSFKNYANHWGICDMHGNVREWCADIYRLYDTSEFMAVDPLAVDKGYNGRHVVRGGHCREDEERCTCASRSAGKIDKYTGFRICCTSLP